MMLGVKNLRASFLGDMVLEYKSYNQMRQEFVDFYYNDVKPRLPEYTKMRRIEGSMQIAFFCTFCSFSLVFAFVIWYEYVSKIVFKILPNLVFIKPVIQLLLGIDIAVVIVSIISLLILSNMGSSANKRGNTRYIQQDLEMELKQYLMPKFVNIFLDDGKWFKKSMYNYQNSEIGRSAENVKTLEDAIEYQKSVALDMKSDKQYHIKDLRSLKILNPYPRVHYDDIIRGNFRGVRIKIYDLKTVILTFHEIVLIGFLIIWLSGMSAGLFALILIFFIIPVIVILLLVFSFLIVRYSKFRGVVVEFDMNKSVKGHTIIHEKSLTSRKIPIEPRYNEVKLEASDFANKYIVYSDDQIEARYLLTPSIMERIEHLKFSFKAKYVRCSFKDNKLTIAIHTDKDMFAMGNDFKDSDSNTFQELYDEMISVLNIVDELKLNQHLEL